MNFLWVPGSSLEGKDKEKFVEIRDAIDKATSDFLIRPDWDTNLRCVELVNPIQATDMLNEITIYLRRKLVSNEPKTIVLTLRLIEALVNNCGSAWHLACMNDKKFCDDLCNIPRKYSRRQVSSTTGGSNSAGEYRDVVETSLDLIQLWGEGFLPKRRLYPQIVDAYFNLRKEGLPFRTQDQFNGKNVPLFGQPPATVESSDAILAKNLQNQLDLEDHPVKSGDGTSTVAVAVPPPGSTRNPFDIHYNPDVAASNTNTGIVTATVIPHHHHITQEERQAKEIIASLSASLTLFKDMILAIVEVKELADILDFCQQIVQEVKTVSGRINGSIEMIIAQDDGQGDHTQNLLEELFTANEQSQQVIDIYHDLHSHPSSQAALSKNKTRLESMQVKSTIAAVVSDSNHGHGSKAGEGEPNKKKVLHQMDSTLIDYSDVIAEAEAKLAQQQHTMTSHTVSPTTTTNSAATATTTTTATTNTKTFTHHTESALMDYTEIIAQAEAKLEEERLARLRGGSPVKQQMQQQQQPQHPPAHIHGLPPTHLHGQPSPHGHGQPPHGQPPHGGGGGAYHQPPHAAAYGHPPPGYHGGHVHGQQQPPPGYPHYPPQHHQQMPPPGPAGGYHRPPQPVAPGGRVPLLPPPPSAAGQGQVTRHESNTIGDDPTIIVQAGDPFAADALDALFEKPKPTTAAAAMKAAGIAGTGAGGMAGGMPPIVTATAVPYIPASQQQHRSPTAAQMHATLQLQQQQKQQQQQHAYAVAHPHGGHPAAVHGHPAASHVVNNNNNNAANRRSPVVVPSQNSPGQAVPGQGQHFKSVAIYRQDSDGDTTIVSQAKDPFAADALDALFDKNAAAPSPAPQASPTTRVSPKKDPFSPAALNALFDAGPSAVKPQISPTPQMHAPVAQPHHPVAVAAYHPPPGQHVMPAVHGQHAPYPAHPQHAQHVQQQHQQYHPPRGHPQQQQQHPQHPQQAAYPPGYGYPQGYYHPPAGGAPVPGAYPGYHHPQAGVPPAGYGYPHQQQVPGGYAMPAAAAAVATPYYPTQQQQQQHYPGQQQQKRVDPNNPFHHM